MGDPPMGDWPAEGDPPIGDSLVEGAVAVAGAAIFFSRTRSIQSFPQFVR